MSAKKSLREELFDRSLTGWIVNTARQEYWRVAAWYDLDDLIQDGFLCFAKCWAAYGKVIKASSCPIAEKKKWMMVLVKTSFWRKICDLHNAARFTPEITESCLSTGESPDFLLSVADPGQIELALVNASEEIQELAQKLMSGAEHRKTKLRKRDVGGSVRLVRSRRRLRETTNQLYSRMMGVSESEPVRERLLECLG